MENKQFNDEFFKKLEKQIKNSKRPTYYSNETYGEFKLDYEDSENLALLKKYIKDFWLVDGYYYFVLKDVSIRIEIKHAIHFTAKARQFYLCSLSYETGAYVEDSAIRVRYWITNKDGYSDGTKPEFLRNLERFTLNYDKNLLTHNN